VGYEDMEELCEDRGKLRENTQALREDIQELREDIHIKQLLKYKAAKSHTKL